MRAVVILLAVMWACGGARPPSDQVGNDLDVEENPQHRASTTRDASDARASRQVAIVGGGARSNTREVIDVDFVDADLHNAFRFLADVARVNIVVGDEVKGTITLRLRGVPWAQVMDTIAEMKGLELSRDGRVYQVGVRRER